LNQFEGLLMLFLGIGFALWLVATIAFRLVGQYLLDPANLGLSIGLFLVTPLAMLIVTIAIYSAQQVQTLDRPKTAMLLALPGMLLDVGSILFFPTVFANIDPNADRLFAGLMLWGYSFILTSGFLPEK
jgi:tellurite resistance protein TehA-like permease